jgi:hypothetical protein
MRTLSTGGIGAVIHSLPITSFCEKYDLKVWECCQLDEKAFDYKLVQGMGR